MNYRGRIVVRNEEGRSQALDWGRVNRLLCEELTGDANFTLAEMRYDAGGVRGPETGHEAFHCLQGEGELRLWLPASRADEPVAVPLRAGTEYYVRGDVRRSVVSSADAPLFGIALLCHIDRPCHAHAFSHRPGEGNFLHYHGRDKWVEPLRQEFVEAMYLVEGPGWIATADPENTRIEDHEIEPGSAVYHPLNTLHRQYNPAGSAGPNFWIHAGYYLGEGRPTAGVFDVPEFAYWQRER
jgi:mannose-6-phosphate isomerase-like protein (cupin superfamily)